MRWCSLRTAWLGLPSCAHLHDLFAIVAAADTERSRSIADLLPKAKAIPGLTDDGRTRFTRLASALAPALAARGRARLSAQVRGGWLALAGPACVEEAVDLSTAERFFALLDEHEHAGELTDWSAFVAALAELCAEPDAEPAADASVPVKVMTLHRAKGLEFDTVILPGLARAPNRSDVDLLRWRRRPQGLLLAPVKASGGTDDPVYRYLQLVKADEEDAELGRLLYVGCTRAKQRLHLVAALDTVEDEGHLAWRVPPHGSALDRLWGTLEASVPGPAGTHVVRPAAALAASPLYRLPTGWEAPRSLPGVSSRMQPAMTIPDEMPPFDWAREVAKHVGTVAHRIFRQIADEGIGAWPASRVAPLASRIRAELTHEGVDACALPDAAQRVETAVLGLLGDARGRWLLASNHQEACSEYALTAMCDGALVNVVLDRTFIDTDGVRWIVDFKLSRHEGADVEGFLDNECERYRPQLERYARALRACDKREIRLGLYFPLHTGWREWAASV